MEEAIQSILDQSFINFEFIIIDDASTDNTSEILKKYSQKDSRIRIFRNEINRERSISRNIAIDKARSDLIAIMDADDYAMYWRLSAQFNFMHDNPDIAVCCGKLQLYEYPEVIWSSPISYEDIYAKLFFESCMYHPTAMYRKSIIDSLGRYDADSPYAEDYMLWFKVAINGIFPVANMDTVLTRYRIHNNKRREYVQCVSDAADTVRRKALATLNLFPNEREWQAHLWLISRFDMRTAEDVRDCRTWLERVEQATATLSPTLRPAFINELKRRWQQLFLRQEQLPLWVGLLYFSSTLADTTWRGIWFFCKTILKRTMRYAKIKILEWF
ncbi:hypothetical protein FACS1894206_08630 [Deltaproteobacteria bacterium]|nr:hypothetical protein FACS1894206_08630 [Deltaproteobacteria bacterium]